jgi:hypothetical protein
VSLHFSCWPFRVPYPPGSLTRCDPERPEENANNAKGRRREAEERGTGGWCGRSVAHSEDNEAVLLGSAEEEESLSIQLDVGDKLGITHKLEELAKVEAAAGQADRAVRLSATAASFFEAMGVHMHH